MPSCKNALPREILTCALSIRQPFVEQILLGKKTEEYRSARTHIRGRVYCMQARRSHCLRTSRRKKPGFCRVV
jgi:hypothetical protein